ncbi:hypothetical protein H0H93_012956 [Arthromyces matolae]|nr:hypothetical protein H0H93_012956 [Arthromyces matolae]
MKHIDEDTSSNDESFLDNSSDSENDYIEKSRVTGSKRKRNVTNNRSSPRKRKASPKPLYISEVTETATNATQGDASRLDNADSNVLAKIRKALRLATHSGTAEAEAKAAMRMATKLMATQNITQADLIASETAEERLTRAGNSRVKISSTSGKKMKTQRWYGIAADAVCDAFDVQCYSENYSYEVKGKDHLDWVFYGLADNTVAAALSFEMLQNQLEIWAVEKKSELKGRTAASSYRIGVVTRVKQDVDRANRQAIIEAEENERKRQEQEAAAEEAARAAEIARLQRPDEVKPEITVEDVSEEILSKPALGLLTTLLFSTHLTFSKESPDEDNDDGRDIDDIIPPCGGDDSDDSDVELCADFEGNTMLPEDFDLDALENKIKLKTEMVEASLEGLLRMSKSPPPPPEPKVDAEPELLHVQDEPKNETPHWTSALQLRTFRDNAKTIAENFLKDSGTKLRKGRKWGSIKMDNSAYNKGWDDGSKVDLKRRRIEGRDVAKQEVNSIKTE